VIFFILVGKYKWFHEQVNQEISFTNHQVSGAWRKLMGSGDGIISDHVSTQGGHGGRRWKVGTLIHYPIYYKNRWRSLHCVRDDMGGGRQGTEDGGQR
jgi:hypothetical protein